MSIQKRAWFSVEEIIHKYCEHKEENMEKNKPLSEWTLSESKAYCEEFRKSVPDSGVCEETPGCILREKGICKAANTWPHLWDLNRLNEPELAICKAVGAKWVSRDRYNGAFVDLWDVKPERNGNVYSSSNGKKLLVVFCENIFLSLRQGDLIEVP